MLGARGGQPNVFDGRWLFVGRRKITGHYKGQRCISVGSPTAAASSELLNIEMDPRRHKIPVQPLSLVIIRLSRTSNKC